MAAQLPSPPFIDIPGLPNFRDLGGYPIASQPGKVVRHGVVFRSAEPSQTTDEGIDRLRQLRIAQVYDLRSTEELERDKGNGIDRGVKEWEGARRIHAPVLDKDDYKPEEIAKRLAGYSEGAEVYDSIHSQSLALHVADFTSLADCFIGLFSRLSHDVISSYEDQCPSLSPDPSTPG